MALLFAGAAWLLKPEIIASAQLGQQSFAEPQIWINDFTREQDWNPEHPRLLADVNGDHRQDVLGFGNMGVWRSLSTGNGFGPVALVVNDFGYDQGWRKDKHVRLLADVNGERSGSGHEVRFPGVNLFVKAR